VLAVLLNDEQETQLFLELHDIFNLSQEDLDSLSISKLTSELLSNIRELKNLLTEVDLQKLSKSDVFNICSDFTSFRQDFLRLDALKLDTFLTFKNAKLMHYLANDLKATYTPDGQAHLHAYLDTCLPNQHKMVNLPLAVFGQYDSCTFCTKQNTTFRCV